MFRASRNSFDLRWMNAHVSENSRCAASVVTAPLLELQAFQPIHIQDFYDSWRNPANKALLFQSRERAFSGSGCHSKIIRKTKPVYR